MLKRCIRGQTNTTGNQYSWTPVHDLSIWDSWKKNLNTCSVKLKNLPQHSLPSWKKRTEQMVFQHEEKVVPRVYRSTDAFSLFFSLQVSKITPGITYKRSITTITRNSYRSPTSVGSCSKVLIPDGQRREKTLDIVQNIRRSLHLRGSTTQKAVILPQTIVSQ